MGGLSRYMGETKPGPGQRILCLRFLLIENLDLGLLDLSVKDKIILKGSK